MAIIAESSDENSNAPPHPAAPSLPQQRGNYSDNLETLAQAAPWIDDALQQARQAHQTIETAIESAITVTKSRLDRILTTSSAHFNQTLDSLQDVKAEYHVYEDLTFGKIKEGIGIAASHPLITIGAFLSLGFLGLKRPRRFLYYKARCLFVSEEAMLSKADAKVKELKKSIDFLKAESEKWEVHMAENENYDPSTDPKRKAKSNDPGWKYGFWPDLGNKDLIECKLCHKQMHSGIKRLKQHLAAGYGDVAKCPNTNTEIMREMQQYIQRNARKKAKLNLEDGDCDDHADDSHEVSMEQRQPSSHDSVSYPSSGTASKRKQSILRFAEPQPIVGKQNKSVVAMLRKTPEEVVEERHSKGSIQRTIEACTRSKEEKERTAMHVANFFYECGIPFNVANSRSFEIMVESIGQMGPGWKPPSLHELRVPLLEKARKEIDTLKEKHKLAWKQYGCTLMSDGWTDRRNRHLINFLVNSPEGTFFLESVDASSQSHDATMLANLLEQKIEQIGKDNVVQVVTDNGANYKAAGRLLEARIPTLFWTPCAAHCLDLMLEDIGKLTEFKPKIESAKRVTTFIYRHGRILNAMRERTGGKDLVRPGATRFATAFLTLQSLYKHKTDLRQLFVSEDWHGSKLANTEAGKKVCDIVLSSRFWSTVEDCIRASHPLLIVLRIVDADETPAMPELSMAMLSAKRKLNESFANKPRLLAKLMDIIEGRWRDQMEVKLYGAALFLNPSKYFDLKANDNVYARKKRAVFNDVLEKMVTDEDLQAKISNQVDAYDNMRGSFGKQLAIKQQKTKNPLDWWNAFGGLNIELQSLAMRIIGLCCSSSGCERNWSTFEFIHTKRRNRLEHKRLNDLVYVQYNRKITTRFQKRREEGANFNPLILEEFQ